MIKTINKEVANNSHIITSHFKKKKGMFFTISTIILISLLMISLNFTTINNQATEIRINTMNDLIEDIEHDTIRASKIIGQKSIIALTQEINKNQEFSDNSKEDIIELFTMSKLNNVTNTFMNDTNINIWIDKIENNAIKQNFNLKINLMNVTIEQSNPWFIDITLKINILLIDNIARFNTTNTITSQVPIIGFEDPTYSINTENKITNIINKGDTTDLLEHVTNQNYITSTIAPSFLYRLEGKKTASNQGVESLVYIPNIIHHSIVPKNRTIVDYLYFSNINSNDQHINQMPSWFIIDEEHIINYE